MLPSIDPGNKESILGAQRIESNLKYQRVDSTLLQPFIHSFIHSLQVYHAMDVTLCTSSILHLSCISLDRYYAIVNQPLLYYERMTKKVCPHQILIMLCKTLQLFILACCTREFLLACNVAYFL